MSLYGETDGFLVFIQIQNDQKRVNVLVVYLKIFYIVKNMVRLIFVYSFQLVKVHLDVKLFYSIALITGLIWHSVSANNPSGQEGNAEHWRDFDLSVFLWNEKCVSRIIIYLTFKNNVNYLMSSKTKHGYPSLNTFSIMQLIYYNPNNKYTKTTSTKGGFWTLSVGGGRVPTQVQSFVGHF